MKRSNRRSSRGKNGDDTGWVRLKLPIATDPGQIQYAVDNTGCLALTVQGDVDQNLKHLIGVLHRLLGELSISGRE
jgi:hypothetical protein